MTDVARYLFDSPQAAAAAIRVVLKHARGSKAVYEFGGLSLESLTSSGLWLRGDIDEVVLLLDKVPGAVRQVMLGR